MDVVGFAAEYLGCSVEVADRGMQGYTRQYLLAGGLRILENEARPEMGVHLLADGGACEVLGFDQLSHIAQAFMMRATRVDLAIDNCPFEPSQLRDEWHEDRVRTRAQPMGAKAQPGREHIRTSRWESSPTGDTFYMGARSSTQFARCYNARGFTRFEMELKAERAAQVWEMMIASPERLSDIVADQVTNFVEFVNLDDTNRSRCTRQDWWAEFIEGVGEFVTFLGARPARTVERVRNWIEAQVSRTLGVYEEIRVKELLRDKLAASTEDARAKVHEGLRQLARHKWTETDSWLVSMA